MYTPALLWMYPYSHRTRAGGDAAGAASASSAEADGETARLHRARQRPRARLGRGDVRGEHGGLERVELGVLVQGRRAGDGVVGAALATPPRLAPRKAPQGRRFGRAVARPARRTRGARARAATGVDGRARGDIARAFAAANGG